ncbi:2-hydroxychromene-2-carboxylate isomerase [Alphaproteobacteria bacterium HT1-32]|nr:2-hydroxychromene-2-carboxylate isomerase [Alphaproteobacteria bacterium HT1-32]
MADPIEFWFDFSSPYAYFAQAKIDDIGARHGRETIWRPFLLGAVFKITGMPPLVEVPMKGEYCLEDWPRLARFQHLPWTMPDPFPIATIAAARAFYWLDETDPAKAKSFARACFDTYFGQGIQIGKPDEVAAVAEGVGVDGAALLDAIQQPEIKDKLRLNVEAAVEKQIFGSPMIIVDGERFWGSDRIWMVKKWLQSGGW